MKINGKLYVKPQQLFKAEQYIQEIIATFSVHK
jgi:hypothetical protein